MIKLRIKDIGFAVLRMLAVVLLGLVVPEIVFAVIMKLFGLPRTLPYSINLVLSRFFSIIFVLLICYFVAKIYKIKARELGMFFTQKWLKNFGLGLCAGAFSVTAIWLLAILLGGFTVTINTLSRIVYLAVFVNLLGCFMVGYYEEVLTRGLMTFLGVKNHKLFNAIVVGIIFSLLHLTSPSYNILSMINTLLVALVFSMLTWISGDLWLAIGYHATWNYLLGSIFNISVSGDKTGDGLLISSPSSYTLISGGDYGLEASLLSTIFFIIQIIFIYVFFVKKGKTNKEPVAPWLA